MRTKLILLLSLSVALFLGACKQEGAEPEAGAPPEATTTEMAGTSSPSDVSPIAAQTWIDDVTIGHALGADGTIPTGRTGDDFAAGRPIHVAMRVGDAPAGSAVKIVWYGPNETKIGEEQKNVATGATTLAFSATNTKGWAKGDYRAEIWIGDEKVNTQQFQIVDAGKAGK
jgi:outer membrane lipoprotein-sorting protein